MAERIRQTTTIRDLQRWEEYGATWRAIELSDKLAILELCTCYGEPVDVVRSHDPRLIEFVREHEAASSTS